MPEAQLLATSFMRPLAEQLLLRQQQLLQEEEWERQAAVETPNTPRLQPHLQQQQQQQQSMVLQQTPQTLLGYRQLQGEGQQLQQLRHAQELLQQQQQQQQELHRLQRQQHYLQQQQQQVYQQQQQQHAFYRQQQQQDASPRAPLRWRSIDISSDIGVSPAVIVATPASVRHHKPGSSSSSFVNACAPVLPPPPEAPLARRAYGAETSAATTALAAAAPTPATAAATAAAEAAAAAAGSLRDSALQLHQRAVFSSSPSAHLPVGCSVLPERPTAAAAAAAEAAAEAAAAAAEAAAAEAAAAAAEAAAAPSGVRLRLGPDRFLHDVALNDSCWSEWKEAIGWQLGLAPNSAELAERVLRRRDTPRKEQQQLLQRQQQHALHGDPFRQQQDGFEATKETAEKDSAAAACSPDSIGDASEELQRLRDPLYRKQRLEEARRLMAGLSPPHRMHSAAAAAAAAAPEGRRESGRPSSAVEEVGPLPRVVAAAAAGPLPAQNLDRRQAARSSRRRSASDPAQDVEITMAPLLGLPAQEQLVEVREKTPPPLGAPCMRRPRDLFSSRRRRELQQECLRRQETEEALLGPPRPPHAVRSPQTARRAAATVVVSKSPQYASDTELLLRHTRRHPSLRRAAAADWSSSSAAAAHSPFYAAKGATEAAAAAAGAARGRMSRAVPLEIEMSLTSGLPPPPRSRQSRLLPHAFRPLDAGNPRAPLPSLTMPFQSPLVGSSPPLLHHQRMQETEVSSFSSGVSTAGAETNEDLRQHYQQYHKQLQPLAHQPHPQQQQQQQQQQQPGEGGQQDLSASVSPQRAHAQRGLRRSSRHAQVRQTAVALAGAFDSDDSRQAEGAAAAAEGAAAAGATAAAAAAAADNREKEAPRRQRASAHDSSAVEGSSASAAGLIPACNDSSSSSSSSSQKESDRALESSSRVNLLGSPRQSVSYEEQQHAVPLPLAAAASEWAQAETTAAAAVAHAAAKEAAATEGQEVPLLFDEWQEGDSPDFDPTGEAWLSDNEGPATQQQEQQQQQREEEQQELQEGKKGAAETLETADAALVLTSHDGLPAADQSNFDALSPSPANTALVAVSISPHLKDPAAAIAAAAEQETAAAASTPRSVAPRSIAETAVSPIRSVQRGIQTSPERQKVRPLKGRQGSVRRRTVLLRTQLDSSTPVHASSSGLRRYPQRTRVKPLLGWMGERVDYDWRGMVEVVRCSNILDLYLKARDIGALPDAALQSSNPERLLRRMQKQQQMALLPPAAHTAAAATAAATQGQQQQQLQQERRQRVLKKGAGSRKRRNSRASLEPAGGGDDPSRVANKRRAKQGDSSTRKATGSKGGKAARSERRHEKEAGKQTRKALLPPPHDTTRRPSKDQDASSGSSSSRSNGDKAVVAIEDASSPRRASADGLVPSDESLRRLPRVPEGPEDDGKTLIRRDEALWRGIGPGDAMQLAVVRQGKRLVSCKLRLKAGFVKGPDNAQQKEIFGVVLSGGPLVLTVRGEDSELPCGAFFQVAPHEVWSLRNDQQDDGYAEIYIACILLDAPK